MARIAYVCCDRGVPVFGSKGASVHVQSMLRSFRRLGHDVTLFAARRGGEAPSDLRNLKVVDLAGPTCAGVAARERSALALNRTLRQLLRRNGRFDIVYERYSLWSHAAMELASREATPAVLEVNAPLIGEQQRHRQLIHAGLAEMVAKRVFASASALLAVSEGVARYLRQATSPEREIHVVANGVDPERYPGARFGQRPLANPADPCTIGFLGTLKPWHGLDTLMQAFAQVHAAAPCSRLLIVGDGPERSSIENAIARYRLDTAVTLTGAVRPERVPDWLSRMDIAVAPYPSMDEFYFSPLKIYEYMAAALPVITTRSGDLEHVVSHLQTGLICEPDDADDLAAALLRLRGDRALARTLGLNARQSVLTSHSWDSIAAKVLSRSGIPACTAQPLELAQ